jgi:beta-phosphoglucomutase-like phosphatase (HAD superfamily)
MTEPVPLPELEAVLFDMDGLIVDTEPVHFQAFREYMKKHGVDMPESMMADFIGLPEADNLRDLKAEYDLDAPLEQMVAERRVIYLDLIRTLPLRVFSGFWEFSAAVRERGLKQAVVSSAPQEQVEIVLSRLFEGRPDGPAADHFDGIVTGDDIRHNKPAPDIYLEGAKRVGVAPDRCLALEDSPPGAQSAISAGTTAIAIPNEYTANLSFPGVTALLPSLDAAREYLNW